MPIQNIDAETLQQWIDNDEALIVDVREEDEHESLRIPGATLIPVNSITKERLPKLSGKKLVVHCHSGKRSMHACHFLLDQDPDLVLYNLEGGIASWSAKGFKTQRG